MVNMPPSIPWKPEYEGLSELMKLVSAGFGHRYQELDIPRIRQ